MSGDDLGRGIYLLLLLLAVGGYFLAEGRQRMGRTAQQALIWALIFVGVMAARGLWNDIRRDVASEEMRVSDGQIEVPAAPDGHFYLTVEIAGTAVRFVVDTGASQVVLTTRDAERLGFATATLGYFGQAQTANGMVRTAPVRLKDIALGPFLDESIAAVVNAGALDTSLLGMSYLSRFEMTLSASRLILRR
jgi:aspartyl protease family protein